MTGDSLSQPCAADELSLYIHVPFCTQKCPYCHFYVIKNREEKHKLWAKSVVQELNLVLGEQKGKKLRSIYFGGGTPSLISPKTYGEILSQIAKFFSPWECEITLEANPQDISKDRLKGYLENGINRLSLGVQSFKNQELVQLGRKTSANHTLSAIKTAASIGFHSISIDLIYDLPHQDLKSWERTLLTAASLPIDHISLYNLVIEEKTLFWLQRKSLSRQMPNEEISEKMYTMACELLHEAGLHQYEISAFARNKHYSIHNSGYWRSRDFLGIGPSAFSFIDGQRHQNIASLLQYSKMLSQKILPIQERETLTHTQRQAELLAVHLRLLEGLSLRAFEARHGPLSIELHESLKKCKKHRLLSLNQNIARLTNRGRLLYNQVGQILVAL